MLLFRRGGFNWLPVVKPQAVGARIASSTRQWKRQLEQVPSNTDTLCRSIELGHMDEAKTLVRAKPLRPLFLRNDWGTTKALRA